MGVQILSLFQLSLEGILILWVDPRPGQNVELEGLGC